MEEENTEKPYGVHLNNAKLPKTKKPLTIAERISVIKLYETVRNTRKLAEMFGCGRTQIQNTLRRKEEYLEIWGNNSEKNRMRLRHSGILTTLGAVVYEWVQRARTSGHELNKKSILRTAEQVADVLRIPKFNPTNVWYSRLKKKYKISELTPIPLLNELAARNKSLEIKDIINDLRDPIQMSKNFILLSSLQQDSLEYFGNALNDEIIQESFPESLENNSDIDDIFKYDKDEMDEFLPFGNDDLISIIETKESFASVKNFSEKIESKSDYKNCLETYQEALQHLAPLAEFALYKGNIKAVELINQLEITFHECATLDKD